MARTLKQKAQTAIELAVFGSILVFVLGVIIRSALIKNIEQQTQLRATRMALDLSYWKSESMTVASHNTTSLLVIEDRLTAASAKYGAVDRTPFMVQASGTHTANMMMPVDFNSTEDLPVMDVYVNGQHFTFSTVAFATKSLAALEEFPDAGYEGVKKLYTIIDNHPKITRWCDDGASPLAVACPGAVCSSSLGPGCNLSGDERFDLARDGTTVVPLSERERFSWQWYLVAGWDESGGAPAPFGEGINVDAHKNVAVDVDGDLKMEQIESVVSDEGKITSVNIRDYQDGDIDTTFHDGDTGHKPGFTRDARIYTFVKDSGNPSEGTYLRIEEGKLYNTDDQYIRTASKKDTIDVIERVFQLSNDTGNICSGTTPVPPVEACGACFTTDNITKTCMERYSGNPPVLFIRSRISDLRGRKWVTPTGSDPYVEFDR